MTALEKIGTRVRETVSKESADELVSHAMYGAEMHRARGIPLQFLPEFQDVVVHGTGRRIVLISPDLVEEFVAADDPIGILHQKLERLKFLSSQDDGNAIPDDFHFLEVGRDAVKTNDLHIGDARGMAEGGTYASQQFARAERLGHIVIGTQLKQQDFVGDVAGGAEHDDRQGG